jgi:hypothetical protein
MVSENVIDCTKALALIEVEILYYPVRVQNPDRVIKDCNG